MTLSCDMIELSSNPRKLARWVVHHVAPLQRHQRRAVGGGRLSTIALSCPPQAGHGSLQPDCPLPPVGHRLPQASGHRLPQASKCTSTLRLQGHAKHARSTRWEEDARAFSTWRLSEQGRRGNQPGEEKQAAQAPLE